MATYTRPRGRAPNGKSWDPVQGLWIDECPTPELGEKRIRLGPEECLYGLKSLLKSGQSARELKDQLHTEFQQMKDTLYENLDSLKAQLRDCHSCRHTHFFSIVKNFVSLFEKRMNFFVLFVDVELQFIDCTQQLLETNRSVTMTETMENLHSSCETVVHMCSNFGRHFDKLLCAKTDFIDLRDDICEIKMSVERLTRDP
jgi:hypothetical protein